MAVATAERRLAPTASRDLLLVGLTVSSGAVDAISFLGLGKVFTAFMTGNVVFLGFGVADAEGPDVLRVLLALAAFAAGVFTGTRLVAPSKGYGRWPTGVAFTLVAALLLEAAFLVLWAATSGHPGTASGHVLTVVMAIAMGLQSAAILSLGVKGVFTTAATATVMFLMSDLATRSGSPPEERRRLAGVLTGLFAGAVAGSLLFIHARSYAPALPVVVTAAVIAAGVRLGATGRSLPVRAA